MSEASRRGFLKYAGVGAALAGAAAVVPGAVSSDDPAKPADVALPAAADGSLVAYVTDVHSGQVALMVDGHEVTVTDHQLVARLAHAMHSARTTTV